MQVLKYLGLLINRASQKSVLLTDRLSILVVPFSTLLLWVVGAKMTETIQETLLLGVAITVAAVVMLRLGAASYLVWKDDQTCKRELRAEIARPEREAEGAMKLHTIELRKALSDRMGRLSAYAVTAPAAIADPAFTSTFQNLVTETDSLINQLSYDFPLRIAAIRLRDYCLKLLNEQRPPDAHFWDQRKLTFRLLHKQDSIADFMTLLELEVLLEDAGMAESKDSEAVEEVKALIRKLGPRLYEPEIRESMKAALRAHAEAKPGASPQIQ